MSKKCIFIDTSRCTACRACQVACKQWKKLPATATVNTGSYQNPPELDGNTLKIVHFSEARVNGEFKWLFFPEQCRHCLTPPCKLVGDMYLYGAIEQDADTGAVLYSERTRELPYREIREACPYDIPRKDSRTGVLTKCNMCIDRVRNNMLPACVKTCPSDTMHFGDRDAMLELAQRRLAELKKDNPAVLLADAGAVRVLYLCEYDPSHYYKHLSRGMPESIGPFSRRDLLGLRPFRG